MKVFFDTSVLVASLIAEHPHHGRAMSVVDGILRGRDDGVVAAHGLAETYAVLTSLPVSPRIAAETARTMMADNILARFEIIALTAREYARLVRTLPEHGAQGGATYDVIHLACARKADAEAIYTFNVMHFRRLAPDLAGLVAAP